MNEFTTKAGNTVKILSEETFVDYAEIVSKYGQEYVEGFQADFSVEVTLKTGESRKFHIVYQSRDRSDNMRAYGTYEMTSAAKYGCDSDESELLEFTGYDEEIIEILESKAEKLCKEFFDRNNTEEE
jgi:hypothetical protein